MDSIPLKSRVNWILNNIYFVIDEEGIKHEIIEFKYHAPCCECKYEYELKDGTLLNRINKTQFETTDFKKFFINNRWMLVNSI